MEQGEILPSLHQTCKRGNEAAVREELRMRTTDIESTASDGNTPLHVASIFGWIRIVKLLIEQGADVNAKNKRGKTPLHEAVIEQDRVKYSYNPLVLRALINEGKAGVDLQDDNGKTALQYAVSRRMTKHVDILLGAKQDLTRRDKEGRNVLHDAVIAGNNEAVTALHDHKPKRLFIQLAQTACNAGKTPFHLAASNGSAYLLWYFLEKGVHPGTKDTDGNTVLHEACRNGHYR